MPLQNALASDAPLEASLVVMLVHHNHRVAVTSGMLGTGLPGTPKIFVPAVLLYFSPEVFACPVIVYCENEERWWRAGTVVLVCRAKQHFQSDERPEDVYKKYFCK